METSLYITWFGPDDELENPLALVPIASQRKYAFDEPSREKIEDNKEEPLIKDEVETNFTSRKREIYD